MRKAWLVLLVLTLFVPMVSASANELKIGDAVVGDVNADGKVDIADVQFALRVVAGLSSLPPERAKVVDLTPVGPGGAVGDGRVGITDVAKLLALVLRRAEFRPVHKVVVEEAGMVLLQNVPKDFLDHPLFVIKEDGEQRIAVGSHRWNMQGDYLCIFQSKGPEVEGFRRVVGVFQDGTPIYEEDLSFNYDKEGNFSPVPGVYSAVGLEYFPDKEDNQDSLSGARLIFGSLQSKDSFSFLCVNQEKEKEVFMETPWIIPLFLGLDGNHAVALEDGRLAVVVEEFLPEYLSTRVRILVTDQIRIGKGFSGLSPWELFAGAQTSEIFLPGLPEVHLAPHRVISEGKIVATTATIYPERISVWDLDLPLFDYQEKTTTLMVVVDPDSKEASFTAFTPKALEAKVEVKPLGVCTIPRKSKVEYGKEKFFVSYLVSTKKGQTAILYPAHLEERLVEITSW